jgi:hypothetical protein
VKGETPFPEKIGSDPWNELFLKREDRPGKEARE